MQEKNITKAYVLHSGGFVVDPRRIAAFVGDFPYIATRYSRMDLEKLVKSTMPEVVAEMDPKVSTADLESLILTADEETKTFFRAIASKRLSEAVTEFTQFPFRNANNKVRIKNALLAVYGQDLAEAGNDALGKPPELPAEKGPATEAEKPPMPEPGDATKTPDAAPAEDAAGAEPQKSIDPQLEEDAVITLQGYLQKYIFNSKLIPSIKVMKAYEVKNGYVLDIEFSSTDEKTKAYAKAVIHNKKLVPPAELEDENENKIGDFSSETFLKLFSVDGGKPKKEENYTELMDQMMESPSYTQAGLVLNKISAKFGSEIANNAFDTFVRVKSKSQKNSPVGSASRLNVKIQ